MLGLSYYACPDCGAVSADPSDRPRCGRCRGRRLREIDDGRQAEAYFAPVPADDSCGSGGAGT